MKKLLVLLFAAFAVSPMLAQAPEDTTDGRFHDDLLNHLVGEWTVTSTAHEHDFTGKLDAAWVLNHQYLYIHLLSDQVIPWWKVRMEYQEFIGYNHHEKQYIFQGMSIEGNEDGTRGAGFGSRTGNELKTVAQFNADTAVVQRFIWQPATGTWLIQSRTQIGGKEGAIFLEMALTRSSKPKK